MAAAGLADASKIATDEASCADCGSLFHTLIVLTKKGKLYARMDKSFFLNTCFWIGLNFWWIFPPDFDTISVYKSRFEVGSTELDIQRLLHGMLCYTAGHFYKSV